MTIDTVSICNLALTKLGDRQIVSLDEASKEARICTLFYEPIRDAVLAEAWWGFATGRAVLAADVSTPAFGRTKQFTLPADCIAVREVMLSTDEPYTGYWTVEGGKIVVSGLTTLYITYTKRITDPASYPFIFIQALAARLAAELCTTLAPDLQLLDGLLKIYQMQLDNARKQNLMEDHGRKWSDITTLTMAKLGSLGMDVSDKARIAKLVDQFLPTCRDMLLQADWWSFAAKRDELTASNASPEFGFDYAFTLPTDCLAVRDTVELGGEWVLEGQSLLTSASDTVDLIYTSQVTDTTKFPPAFTNALAARIALEIVPEFPQKGALEACYKLFQDAIRQAKSVNAIEQRGREYTETYEYETVRA